MIVRLQALRVMLIFSTTNGAEMMALASQNRKVGFYTFRFTIPNGDGHRVLLSMVTEELHRLRIE